jgi:hypothetical protein
MTAAPAELRFNIGVCRVFPGLKLPRGDPRWRQHTRSFVKEEHTVASLAKAVAVDGCSISPVMRDDYRVGKNFVSCQHLGLDFDDGIQTIEMLMENDFIRDFGAIVHETASSTPTAPRSRVIFILDSPFCDAEEYKLAAEALLHRFGTADEQCRDEARFYYGRKNARCAILGNILYRDVLYEQVIEPYQRAKASTNGHRLASPVPDAIPEKSRNSTLTSLAGTMRRRGMSEDAIYAALQAENTARCVPPLDAEEIRTISHSVSRYEPAAGLNEFNAFNAYPQVELRQWPGPMAEEAFQGLAGDVVKAIEPHTEASREALLINSLVAFGNAVSTGPHALAEADKHGCNIFAVLVGQTSKGRKGSSWSHIRELFKRADPEWADNRILGGLSSGEGLIWSVRDAIFKTETVREKGKPTKETVTYEADPGVADKRLLVVEPEFSSVLQVMDRETNTLSAIIRQAWDSGTLRTMTKNAPARATGAHISIVGHITKEELTRHLGATEAANGFANRFLWVCTKRAQVLPEGGGEPDYNPLVEHLHNALQLAGHIDRVRRDDEAREAWAMVYPDLSEGQPGLFGAIVSRGEAQVLRLSVLYAALDGSRVIQLRHLKAALAVWEYCEASARCIFGDATGDVIADRILAALDNGEMDRTALYVMFSRNVPAARIAQALLMLQSLGRVRVERRDEAPGRPREIWMKVV